MNTQSPSWQRLVVPVLFALACFVITIGVWRSFGGSVPLEGAGYRITVQVPEADSVFANTPVKTAGVAVGHVVEVERDGKRARLVIEMDAEFVPVRRKARAMIRSRSLLGEAYVELVPGPQAARGLRDGEALPPNRVRTSESLDDVLGTFDPRTRAQFRELFAGTDRAFRGRGAALNSALGRTPATTAATRDLLATLAVQERDLARVMQDSRVVMASIGDDREALTRAVRATSRVLSTTGNRSQDLRATVRSLPGLLVDLRAAARQVGAAGPELATAVTALKPAVSNLEPALAALVSGTPAIRSVFRRLPVLYTETEPTLGQIDRVVDQAGPSLAAIYDASREAIPLLQLLNANRDSIVGAAANVSSMANGQHIIPGQLTRSYVSASLTAWNEIVGGWVKKLPTNRQNPYPAPGSARKIAHGGLEAYDCRNVNNAAIFPALGTGVPDCRLQQPWTFNGRTAQYPRLLRAEP